jgi:glycosyltransferase involved in cell wall biosynthesis
VIPTQFRHPDKLERAIRCVLDQRKGDHIRRLEILVCNNSDTEPPISLGRLLQHPVIRVVPANGVQGVSHARNTGAKAAAGQVLAFLDDDDWWAPHYLDTMVSELLKHDVAMALSAFWNHKGGDTYLQGKTPKNGLRPTDVFGGNRGLTGSNIVIRKAAYQSMGGFDENLPTSNDLDFLLRFLLRGLSYHAGDHRLVYKDQTRHDKLTRWDRRKIQGTQRFFEKHRPLMDKRIVRHYDFKLQVYDRLARGSSWSILFLWFKYPGKYRSLLYYALDPEVHERRVPA